MINLKLILTAAYIVSKSAVLWVVSVSSYNVALNTCSFRIKDSSCDWLKSGKECGSSVSNHFLGRRPYKIRGRLHVKSEDIDKKKRVYQDGIKFE